jgi:nicotinamidase-related amidase
VSRRSFLKSAGTAAALAVGGVSAFRPVTADAEVQRGDKGVLQVRSQVLGTDATGHAEWQVVVTPHTLDPARSAIVICDMWDRHWSRGATERVGKMAPIMNNLIKHARTLGVHIVHAPSDTMPFYTDAPARKRVLDAPAVEPPPPIEHADALLPIDDSDGGSDTGEKPWFKAWSRQHPAIEIDQERDAISDSGWEVYSYLHPRDVRTVFVMGVHTNMCVINRSFGIKQLVRWGLQAVLIRDLTDAMYNPAMRPYVSHAEGTRLVVEYIEKFWCPSVESRELLA